MSVGPASGVLKGAPVDSWKGYDVAETVLIDRSTARLTTGQRTSLNDVEGVTKDTRDGLAYWVYEHVSQARGWRWVLVAVHVMPSSSPGRCVACCCNAGAPIQTLCTSVSPSTRLSPRLYSSTEATVLATNLRCRAPPPWFSPPRRRTATRTRSPRTVPRKTVPLSCTPSTCRAPRQVHRVACASVTLLLTCSCSAQQHASLAPTAEQFTPVLLLYRFISNEDMEFRCNFL